MLLAQFVQKFDSEMEFLLRLLGPPGVLEQDAQIIVTAGQILAVISVAWEFGHQLTLQVLGKIVGPASFGRLTSEALDFAKITVAVGYNLAEPGLCLTVRRQPIKEGNRLIIVFRSLVVLPQQPR